MLFKILGSLVDGSLLDMYLDLVFVSNNWIVYFIKLVLINHDNLILI